MYDKFTEFIKDKQHICVVQAENPDGDSLGSALALEEALADKDPRVRVLSNDTNIGVLKTRLKGVHSSFGKWIAFLDSDDVWESDKLEKQVRLQEERG